MTVDVPPSVSPTAEPATHNVPFALELDGMHVRISLPTGWSKDAANSDERMGAVVFKAEPAGSRSDSLLLDATRGVEIPPSLANAAERAAATSDCDAPHACSELSRAMLSGGGMQVSVKRPHAMSVATWLPAANGRAIRCSIECWDSDTSREPAWLSDRAALDRVRLESEALCQSVTADAEPSK